MAGFIAEVEREGPFRASQTNQPVRLDGLRLAAATMGQIDCDWHGLGTTGQCSRIQTASKGPTESTIAGSLGSILVANRVSSGYATG